jgi:hypothetical protein
MSEVERIDTAGASVSVWREAPSLFGLRTAALGRFACYDAADGAAVLDSAVRSLAREGFGAVLGPMDGDTWSAHRLVVDSDGSPPFLLEPHNPEHYPAAFEAAGFDRVAGYVSSRAPAGAGPRAIGLKDVRLRPFDAGNAARDLSRLYRLASRAFAGNAFYKPISEERFIAAYAPFLHALDPDFSLMAEDENGDLAGFLFGYPNYAEGVTPTAAVIKTFASIKPGVGALLVRAVHIAAERRGYTDIVHALMHEANPSLRLSHKFGGRPFRRYALWGKQL